MFPPYGRLLSPSRCWHCCTGIGTAGTGLVALKHQPASASRCNTALFFPLVLGAARPLRLSAQPRHTHTSLVGASSGFVDAGRPMYGLANLLLAGRDGMPVSVSNELHCRAPSAWLCTSRLTLLAHSPALGMHHQARNALTTKTHVPSWSGSCGNRRVHQFGPCPRHSSGLIDADILIPKIHGPAAHTGHPHSPSSPVRSPPLRL